VEQGKIDLRRDVISVQDAVIKALETASPWVEEREHRVVTRLPDTDLFVDADPARLEQILVNLLSNAAKYTDPGGEIVVSAVRDDDQVATSVRDSGVGISAEFLPHVFDLFTQGNRSLARSEGGLGIGLTLTRTLVEMHGGSIAVHSAGPGLGADFVFRLPLVTAPAERATVSARPPKATSQRRVLIIEDNRDAAETLGELLEMEGHQVRVAHDGRVGLDAVRMEAPEVVILDIGLPGMDGYQVAQEIRSLDGMRDALLIAVTGYGQAGDRERALEAGLQYHLTKPTDPLLLLEALGP
jgi:CheY-like chemotaxis protein